MEQKKEKISKSVWILNHYAVTPDMSGGTRHYDLMLQYSLLVLVIRERNILS